MAQPQQTAEEIAQRDPSGHSEALFRTEVLDERKGRWLGTVLLAPTVSQNLFSAFAALAIAAILVFLFFGEYTRKERINGWLVPERGLVRVVAPQSGVIAQLHVKDGDKVDEGAPLVSLSTEIQSQALGKTQGGIVQRMQSRRESLIMERELLKRSLQEELDGLDRRIRALNAEHEQLADEIEIQRMQAQLAREAAERLRPLLDKGFVTASRIESAEANRLDQDMRLLTLGREQMAIKRELLGLQAERQGLPFKSQEKSSVLERDVATLEQELAAAEAEREIIVTAAQAGTVTALRAERGSSVDTTIPLLSIVPEGSLLTAQLFVPSSAIGFIRPGQEVLLRYGAFPYQKFGHHKGAVVSVSRSTVTPNELGSRLAGVTSLLRGDQPVYIVTVSLARQSVTAYGKALPLQPGMQLQADVLIETRSLIEWVFDPLYTLTGRGEA